MSKGRELKLKIASVVLASAMLTGCAYRVKSGVGATEEDILQKKSDSSVKTEGAVEAFYDAEIIPMYLPTSTNDYGFTLFNTDVETPVILRDWIIVPICRYYSSGNEIETVWGPEVADVENKFAVYDLSGNFISYLSDEASFIENPFFGESRDGSLFIACNFSYYDEDKGRTIYDVYFVSFDPKTGSVIDAPRIIFADATSALTGLIITNDDKIIFSTENDIVLTSVLGDELEQYTFNDQERVAGLWEENGYYYAEFLSEAYGDETGKLIAFDKDSSGSITLTSNSKSTDNLAGMKLFQNSNGVYAATRNSLGKLDLASGEFSRLLDWNQTDVDRSLLANGTVRVLEEGELSQTLTVLPVVEGKETPVPSASQPLTAIDETEVAYSEVQDPETSEDTVKKTRLLVATTMHGDSGDVPCLVKLTPSDTNPHAGQNVVWVGGVGISDSPIMTYIAQYNSNAESSAWVKIYDYADYAAYDDELEQEQAYQDALRTMETQVRSGVGPDIILGAGESGRFDNNSCLTDLNGYVDGLRGIDRSTYFDSVIRAFETNGKLYQIPLAFQVFGVLGNTYYADGKTTLSYRDFTEIGNYRSADISLFCYYPSDLLLSVLSESDMTSWINYENGTSNIDRNNLIEMLELIYTNAQNSGFAYEGYPYLYEASILESVEWLYNGNSSFAIGKLDSLTDYAMCHMRGGNYAWYSIPGQTTSTVVKSDVTCGISTYSTQKELAWDVISYLLSEDVQREIGSRKDYQGDYYRTYETRFPVSTVAFEKINIDEAARVGEIKIKIYANSAYGAYDEISLGSVKSLSSEFIEWMKNPQRRFICDPDAIKIVTEEAASYVNDEIEVTQAADNIRRRLNVLASS